MIEIPFHPFTGIGKKDIKLAIQNKIFLEVNVVFVSKNSHTDSCRGKIFLLLCVVKNDYTLNNPKIPSVCEISSIVRGILASLNVLNNYVNHMNWG